MKTLREYLIENSSSSFKKIEIIVRDRENNLEELLNYIKDTGNVGHSFSIIVDPDSSTKKRFGWDGDGHDYIKSIKVNLINENLNEEYKTFSEINKSKGKNDHHLKLVCVKCGTTQTCRCSVPKTEINGICDTCATGKTLDQRIKEFMDNERKRK